uniref:Alternative protein ENPP6 n=1 Tax=Homo sapiens TaxID=9606 RepID=L8ECN5_HUMAN|nr:alternative protein ENPP6 [Homo sapiens]
MIFILCVNNSFINTIKTMHIVNTLFLDNSIHKSSYLLKKIQTLFFQKVGKS